VESTKSVSDVYTPVAGVVAAVNERLAEAPETVNSDPYGAGWLVEIRVEAADDPTTGLLEADDYQALVDAS
jgi:glycine cleavage system H protein